MSVPPHEICSLENLISQLNAWLTPLLYSYLQRESAVNLIISQVVLKGDHFTQMEKYHVQLG